ncbi:MAG: hypothetical protein QM820_12380 [Minicystis sp.]
MIAHANHDPQPAVPDEALFIAGDPSPRLESVGLSWFRVYRESERDHNGVDDPGYDDPWYDTPANRLQHNHAIFIVTCGAGGSRGFRSWDGPDADPSSDVVDAGAQAEFGGDPALFASLQREERVLWYRCEWSPANGGNSRTIANHAGTTAPWA